MKTEYTMEVGTGKNKEIIVFEAPDGLSDRQLSDLADTALKKAKPGQTFKHPVYDKAEQTHIDTHPKPPAPKPPDSTLRQLGRSVVNTAAGLGQGVGALPDMAAQALGKVASIPFNALGDVGEAIGNRSAATLGHRVAHDLAFPHTIGGTIEEIAPTPPGFNAHAARFGASIAASPVALNGALRQGVNALAGTVPKAAGALAAKGTVQAAQAHGIHVGVADAGGSATRRVASAFKQTVFGSGPLARSAAKTRTTTQSALKGRAQAIGTVSDKEGAGEAVQAGMRAGLERMRVTAGEAYDRALSKVHPNVPVVVDSVITAGRALRNKLSGTPATAKLLDSPEMKKFTDAIESDAGPHGSMPLEAARKLKTAIDQAIDYTAITDRAQAAGLKNLRNELHTSITRALDVAEKTGAAKPGTGAALKKANDLWRARQVLADRVFAPLLKPNVDGQPAYTAINRWAKGEGGNPGRLESMLGNIPEAQANTLRATVLRNMGEKDGSFSIGKLVDDWDKMSSRARAALFPGSHGQAVSEIVKIARESKMAATFDGHSNTGAITHVLRGISAIALGAEGGGSHPAVAGGTLAVMALHYLGAEAMGSATVARAVSAMAKNPMAYPRAYAALQAATAHHARLSSGVAALGRAVNDNMPGLSAAAQPSGKEKKHNPETDEILKTVAEEGRRSQAQWDEEDRQQQQTELPDLQDGPPE